MTAVATLLYGIDKGSNDSWTSPTTCWSLGASAITFSLFLVSELVVAAEPFTPGHILFERSLLACTVCNFFAYGCYLALLYFLPLYWQAVERHSATQAALRLLPGITAGVVGSLLSGVVMSSPQVADCAELTIRLDHADDRKILLAHRYFVRVFCFRHDTYNYLYGRGHIVLLGSLSRLHGLLLFRQHREHEHPSCIE